MISYMQILVVKGVLIRSLVVAGQNITFQ